MRKGAPILFLLATCYSTAGVAESDVDADALHDEHCMSCHGTEVYTREDRMIQSLPALETQVRRCENVRGLRWFDDEVTAVTNFLNEHFYKFAP